MQGRRRRGKGGEEEEREGTRSLIETRPTTQLSSFCQWFVWSVGPEVGDTFPKHSAANFELRAHDQQDFSLISFRPEHVMSVASAGDFFPLFPFWRSQIWT